MTCITTEADVGITQFLNQDNPGFTGRLKERFSDFNVIEIDPGGRLVTLVTPPKTAEELAAANRAPVSLCPYADLPPDEQKIISEADYDKLLLMKKSTGTDEPGVEISKLDISVKDMDKTDRKTLHGLIKRQELKAETIVDEATKEKVIRVVPQGAPRNKHQVVGVRGRSKEEKFLHFSLYKENQTTAECLAGLARGCGTKDRYFTTAGTKDKRGRTVQRVAVSQIKPETVEKAAAKLRGIVAVGNYSFHPQGLRLGDLKGNRFQIVVKQIDIEEKEIRPIMEHLSQHGFINYFGMQRFGTSNISTHKIGLAILKKDFDSAIRLILAPKEHQFKDLRTVLEKYAVDGDAKAAYASLNFRTRNSIEGKLLYGLQNCHKNDKVNALKSIPGGIRQMYGHAYQSYVWNSVVSRRLAAHGMAVLEGDLVQDKDNITHRLNVKHLATVSDHTIHDVFIPLPGYEAKLPDNPTRDYMMELLAEDGLQLSHFRSLTREYDLPGDYRAMLTKANDVSWRTVRYRSNEDDLVHSQLEIKNAAPELPDRQLGDKNGDLNAFVLELSLDASCYATMALREIMRIKTDLRSLKNIDETEDEGIDAVSEEKADMSTLDEKGDIGCDQNGSSKAGSELKRANNDQNGEDREPPPVKKSKL